MAIPPALLQKPAGGGFGGKKALEQENAELRHAFELIGATERERIRADIERLRSEHNAFLAQIQAEQAQAQAQLARLRAEVVATSDEAILQEVGIYQYRHGGTPVSRTGWVWGDHAA